MIYSLVEKRIEDGGWSGIPRLDFQLRRIIPGLKSVAGYPPRLSEGDIVIAPNHLSLRVPQGIRTIIMLQGTAATHYERDPEWRTRETMEMVIAQGQMFGLPNRTFMAPGAWVVGEFKRNCGLNGSFNPPVIVNWADPIPQLPKPGKPKILGNWKDPNKGSLVWRKLQARRPDWEFVPLGFRDLEQKRRMYGEASLYLCLSLSEGGPYSVADAEAAELPIVTTDVGNYLEFDDCMVIPWQERDNVELVIAAIEQKLRIGRRKPSYFKNYTFDCWKRYWEKLIQ